MIESMQKSNASQSRYHPSMHPFRMADEMMIMTRMAKTGMGIEPAVHFSI
jgi:hypothetical protein